MEYESDAKLGSPLYNPRKTERGVIIHSLGLVTLCSGRVSKPVKVPRSSRINVVPAEKLESRDLQLGNISLDFHVKNPPISR
jgi:hypothetical protein